MLPKNTFGHLIRTYRRLRGWSQADLAQRWGYSREYVSQIERGQRKLDSLQQVLRLADLLDIPQDQLDAIGRGIPRRSLPIQRPEQADSAILQMLLAPSRDMVQLSYLLWIADQAPSLEDKLHDLVSQLDQALISYHGDLLQPAQQLLAYAHQMLGRMAVDRLDLAAAAGHFSEAIALGEELRDPDLLTIGMVYQGSLLRKRGRFETAIRCFEAARQHLIGASPATQGMYYVHLSTVYADSGQETPFLRCIEQALDLVSSQQDSLAGLANDFSLDDVLWAKAGGFAELWKPAEAVKVFEETDRLRPFRPLRELGAYTINKGKAYLRLGDLEEGLHLVLKGLELATEYRSARQIGWVERIYTQLRALPIGKDKRLETLKDALSEARRKLE
ncbi:helix-turn-helix domain-containing protein [Thermogemmatispora carboxidivorans]|uniref:helix-turn-helix domain-containing protein n=1 Tax=Thermogemmatispora carboxidivorans TaxID=1382306 RepID=UPI00069A946B|nr:helix-turn-helix transcriptional regulator [Thermogemmatispora carboxidivorans]